MRVGDPARWLAARFVADPARRAELTALYALNLEWARVAGAVSNPLAGEIRLAWWREAVEALWTGDGGARHPALAALAGAVADDRLSRAELELLIEARHADLEPEPFPDEARLARYLDETAGAVMRAGARLLAPETSPELLAGPVSAAGRAWGWARWLAAGPALDAAGRPWRPSAWAEASREETVRHVRHRIAEALAAAREGLGALPVSAFPAVAYATLAGTAPREPGGLETRTRLLAAVLRGRV